MTRLILTLALVLAACPDEADTRDAVDVTSVETRPDGVDDIADGGSDAIDEFEWRRRLSERCQRAPELGGQSCGCPDTATVVFEDVRFDCLLCGLMRCSDIRGGFTQSFGSTTVSAVRYATDICYYRIIAEVEGAVTVYDCSSYPGYAPWPALLDRDRFPGIEGVSPYCPIALQCSLLDPENPCPSDLLVCGT